MESKDFKHLINVRIGLMTHKCWFLFIEEYSANSADNWQSEKGHSLDGSLIGSFNSG